MALLRTPLMRASRNAALLGGTRRLAVNITIPLPAASPSAAALHAAANEPARGGSAGSDQVARKDSMLSPAEQERAAQSQTARGLNPATAPRVDYLETCVNNTEDISPALRKSLFRIGNSPLVGLEGKPGFYAKLDGHNPGSSLKDRTITSIVLNSFGDGELARHGERLVLVTSGSAGVSLVKLHKALRETNEFSLDVLIVMPKAYAHKQVPSELIAMEETEVFTSAQELLAANAAADAAADAAGTRCQILLQDGVFIDVLAETRELAAEHGWKMLEQHTDANSVLGHRSTAEELLLAVPGLTDVVCSTGTGATAAGLRRFLPSHVRVHSRAAESGSIDGLSDVRRYNNFCDTTKLANYDTCLFDKETAEKHTKELSTFGISTGPSGGACYWLAQQVMDELESTGRVAGRDAKIAFICADGSAPSLPETYEQYMSKYAAQRNGKSAPPAAGAPHRFARRGPWTLGGGPSSGMSMKQHQCIHTQRRSLSASAAAASPATEPEHHDYVIVGGGPVGASTAWFLSENEVAQRDSPSIVCVHDPKNRGAHEDWSRLARLSFDGPADEMDLSRHAVGLLDLIDEVKLMNSGDPVIPIRPGMVFLASPGTDLARACANGEAQFGDDEFRRVDWRELEGLFPGNSFTLPEDTLAWTHPTGYCVSPLELAEAARRTAEAYGVKMVEARAAIDCTDDGKVRVSLDDGSVYVTNNCYLFAGAASKELIDDALRRDPARNAPLRIPEFDDTYITAISTVRYAHVHHPAEPAPGSGHVPTPIVLGQLEVPDVLDFQANFSIVAEEMGDVLKTRLSGSIGSEVVETVADMKKIGLDDDGKQDREMGELYQRFFGSLFPFLSTEKALDFNRCVTYRNYNHNFSGTSLVRKEVGPSSSLMSTVGCFGVGVKFGPALGEAAAAHTFGQEVQLGMNVFESGDPSLLVDDDGADRIDRAW